MTVVDSCVWINHMRDIETPAVGKLRAAILHRVDAVLVGDLVLLEVLQGARDEPHAGRIERDMRRFRVINLLDQVIAVETARNFRTLRALGLTVRKTIDLIIGTYCLHHGHALLSEDRDFAPMVRHLGLISA